MTRGILILTTLVLLSAGSWASAAIVIVDTQVNPANGHTYHLLSPSTWTDAEAMAVSLGGHLVTINDALEEQWVWNTFNRTYDVYPYFDRLLWIGLTDIDDPGTFTWTSGEEVTYTNWAPGQPSGLAIFSDPTSVENYVQMGYQGHSSPSAWNDLRDMSSWSGLPIQGVVEIGSAPVPEPSTLVLFAGLSVMGLLMNWRTRRRTR